MPDASAAARDFTRQAVLGLVRETGGEITARPMFRHDPSSLMVSNPDPAAGMHAARVIEMAARGVAREYIREARQDGLTWQQIGAALGIKPGSGQTAAEAAFDYAAPRDGHYAQAYGQSFSWRCPSCQGMVSDHGPDLGPHDGEPGHADGCERFATTVAAWDAQWEEDDGN